MTIALAAKVSAYDASYVAVAQVYGIRCYTADRKFFTAIRESVYRDAIAWLDEPPTYLM